MRRIELEGTAKRRDCAVQVALLTEHVAEVNVSLGVVGLQLDSLQIGRERAVKVALR